MQTIKITEISHSGFSLEYEVDSLKEFVTRINSWCDESTIAKGVYFIDDDFIEEEIEIYKENADDEEDFECNKKYILEELTPLKGNYAFYNSNDGSYIKLGKDLQEVVENYCKNITKIADRASAVFEVIMPEKISLIDKEIFVSVNFEEDEKVSDIKEAFAKARESEYCFIKIKKEEEKIFHITKNSDGSCFVKDNKGSIEKFEALDEVEKFVKKIFECDNKKPQQRTRKC